MHCRFILVAMLLSFCSVAQTVQAQDNTLDQILVTVNGSPITESEIQRRINWSEFLIASGGEQPQPPEISRNEAVRNAIDFRLMLDFAATQGIDVGGHEIEERLSTILELNNQTPEQFFAEIAASDVNQSDVIQNIAESLLNEKLVREVWIRQARVRDEEVDRFLAMNPNSFREPDEYSLSVIMVTESLTLNLDQRQLLQNVVSEVQREFHKGADFESVAIAAGQIEGVSVGNTGWVKLGDLNPDLANQLSPEKVETIIGPIRTGGGTMFAKVERFRDKSDEVIPLVDQFHLSTIVMNATNEAGAEANFERLEELRNSIVAGADFRNVAKVYSHDIESKKSGGDLGWLSENQVPFEYLEPLADLSIGDVSPVQQVGDTVFILKLENIRPADKVERIRSLVREQLRDLKIRNERIRGLEQLRDTAVIEYR